MKERENIMENEKRIIPVAERHTVFPSSCNIKTSINGAFDVDRGTSEEEFEKMISDALLFPDGLDTRLYLDEYPIVIYQCDECACPELDPDFRLNSFVKSIHLSIADAGIQYSLSSSNSFNAKYIGEDVVAYFIDNHDNLISINENDIIKFLFQKPNLLVSPEGILVFYTDKEIVTTLDMEHYSWIRFPESCPEGTFISDGIVDDSGIVFDIGKDRYWLELYFDFTELNPIKYTFNKVE